MAKLCTGLSTVVLVCIVQAAPAQAHNGVDHDEDSLHPNLESRIDTVSPGLPQVQVEIVDRGDSIRVTNLGDGEILIPGYEGEPYLRISPGGVFENVLSPAGVINSDRYGNQEVVGDATAEPDWRLVDTGRSAEWHDHRIHWMSPEAPKIGRDEPDRDHVIIENWLVPISHDGTPIEITGDLVWNASQPTLPWSAAALGLAMSSIVIARRRSNSAMTVSLALLTTAYAAHYLFTSGLDSRAAVPGVVVLAGLTATYLSTRPDWRIESTFVAIVASVFVLVTAGVPDIARLTPSITESAITALIVASGVVSVVMSLIVLVRERTSPGGGTSS